MLSSNTLLLILILPINVTSSTTPLFRDGGRVFALHRM
jgi:hypothetical protein